MSEFASVPMARETQTPSTADHRFDWCSYVDTLAMLHDLKLDADQREAVVRQLERIDALSRTFMEFPLEAEVEPAPVFRP